MEAALALMENILEVFARNLLMLIDELIFERAVLCFIFVFNGGGAFENFYAYPRWRPREVWERKYTPGRRRIE